jgi:hypothetical protein
VRSPSPSYLDDVHSGSHPSKKRHCTSSATSSREGLTEEVSDIESNHSAVTQGSRATRHSTDRRGAIALKPTTLSFFGPLWVKLLDEAKAKMQLYVAMEDPFPRLQVTIEGQCNEILMELVVSHQQDGNELEVGTPTFSFFCLVVSVYSFRLVSHPGYYPLHRRSMA